MSRVLVIELWVKLFGQSRIVRNSRGDGWGREVVVDLNLFFELFDLDGHLGIKALGCALRMCG